MSILKKDNTLTYYVTHYTIQSTFLLKELNNAINAFVLKVCNANYKVAIAIVYVCIVGSIFDTQVGLSYFKRIHDKISTISLNSSHTYIEISKLLIFCSGILQNSSISLPQKVRMQYVQILNLTDTSI